MKLGRTLTMASAALTSNVPESPPAAWAGGTTFGLGDLTAKFAGTVATVYESLQAANTGNDPAVSPLWWRQVATAYADFNAGTNYGANDVVTDPATHRLFKSVQPGNLGHALDDPLWWFDNGPSNRWAMFDQKTGTVTTRAREVAVDIDVTGRIDAIGLLNLSAAAVNVTMSDGAGEVYNEDFSLVSTAGIADWWSYFFEPIVRKTDLVIEDLPNVANPTLSVSLTDPAGDVSIGQCLPVLTRTLGGTRFGSELGIRSYSLFEEDTFGNWTFVRRGYAKTSNLSAYIERDYVDQVFNLLAGIEGEPVLMIGSGIYASAAMFGIFRNWKIVIERPTESLLSATFQGV